MKKAYSKPEIMFEDFALNENIAGNCQNVVSSNQSKGKCGIQVNDDDFFFTVGVISGCTIGPDENICYDVPYDYSTTFNS